MDNIQTKNMWIIVTIANVLLFSLIAGIQSQDVSFATTDTSDSTNVIVGQPVEFLCSYINFNNNTDRVEISFQGMVALVFDNGMFTQHSVPSGSEYTTEILSQVVDGNNVPSGILLRINAVKVTDAGQYQCSITDSTQTYQSQIISITTNPSFPTPVCFAPQSDDLRLDPITGNIHAKIGVIVTVPCVVSTDMEYVSVTLAWSRSDEKAVEQSGNFSPSYLTFVPSLGDNFVDFTCTATNSQYEGISQSCSFQLTVSERFGNVTFRPTSRTPTTMTHTETPAEKDGAIGIIAGAGGAGGLLLIVVIAILCVCCVRYAKRKRFHSGDEDSFDSMEDINNTAGYLPPAPAPSQRISYENSAISMNDYDENIITSSNVPLRPPSARLSYENSSMNHTNETVNSSAKPPLRPPTTRFSYENSTVPMSDNIAAIRPPSSTVPLQPPVAVRTSYENAEPSRFDFPSDYNDLDNPGQTINPSGNDRAVNTEGTDVNVANFVAENDLTGSGSKPPSHKINAKRMSNGVQVLPSLYSEVPVDRQPPSTDISRVHQPPMYAQTQPRKKSATTSDSTSDKAFNTLPVYAEVSKSRNSVSSVFSSRSSIDDDSIPSYAAVDKGRTRKSIDVSEDIALQNTTRGRSGSQYADVDISRLSSARMPPRSSMSGGSSLYDSVSITDQNATKERSSLQYADVNFSGPSSNTIAPLYDSVPETHL